MFNIKSTITKAACSAVLSLTALSAFAGNTIISDKAPRYSYNSSTDTASYFTSSLSSGGVRVPNGQIAINTDFEAVAATPDQAGEFTEAGFYFLTYGKTPNGNIPLDMELQSWSFFQQTRREVKASVYFTEPTTECSAANNCEVRYALVWNYEFEGIGDDVVLSQFVNPETRELEIMTATPLLRADASLEFGGQTYNFQLTPRGDKYVADLHPEIGASCCPTAFNIQYTTINQINYQHVTDSLFYYSGNTLTTMIPKGYFLTGNYAGEFTFYPTIEEKTHTVYIHYTVISANGTTAEYNYLMQENPEGDFEYEIPEFVVINEGDKVEFYATYNIDQLYYDTTKQVLNF